MTIVWVSLTCFKAEFYVSYHANIDVIGIRLKMCIRCYYATL